MMGRDLSIPQADCPNRLTTAEQIAIAATHAAERLFDETDDLSAVWRRQPFSPRLMTHSGIDQHCCKLAVVGVLLPAVQCAQHQDQPPTLLPRQLGNGRWRITSQLLP